MVIPVPELSTARKGCERMRNKYLSQICSSEGFVWLVDVERVGSDLYSVHCLRKTGECVTRHVSTEFDVDTCRADDKLRYVFCVAYDIVSQYDELTTGNIGDIPWQ